VKVHVRRGTVMPPYEATLINVVYAKGKYQAIIVDSEFGDLFVVDASDLDEWEGPV